MRIDKGRLVAVVTMALLWGMLALGAAPAVAQSAVAPKRLAFVIGNGGYTGIPPLQNALNDANATRTVLQEAGFDVVPATDATLTGLRSALATFIERVRTAGTGSTALVYYAGMRCSSTAPTTCCRSMCGRSVRPISRPRRCR